MRSLNAQNGFTLLELLVAMSLMVVASACLFSSLYTGFKAKRNSESRLYPLQAARTAMDMLEQDLCGAVVGPEDDPNLMAGPFVGIDEHIGIGPDADQVTFYSTHHQINGDTDRITGGIGRIELAMTEDPNNGTYRLVRRVTDNILSTEMQEPVEDILCRHVCALNVRYYDGLRWYDAWDSTEQMDALPLAVEVTLVLPPWPRTDPTGDGHLGRSQLPSDDPDLMTRIIQVFTLPRAVPLDDVEAAAEAAETAQTNTTVN